MAEVRGALQSPSMVHQNVLVYGIPKVIYSGKYFKYNGKYFIKFKYLISEILTIISRIYTYHNSL